MKFRLRKLMILTLVTALLCSLLPLGATATTTAPEDLVSLVATSRAEIHKKVGDGTEVVALAFRFRVATEGLEYGPNRTTKTDHATVEFGDVTYRLVRMGAVMANRAVIGNNPNALVCGASGTTTIEGKYLFGLGKNYGEYVTRIVNIPVNQMDTLIYARPYFVYLDGSGEEVTVYGTIESANASGKKVRYSVETSSLDWTAGTLSEEDGTEQESLKKVRTDFINDTDLLIRLPEASNGTLTTYVRAYYYSTDAFLSAVDITANWTVLKDLGVPKEAVCVRLVAYSADGSDITDAGTFGNAVLVTANKKLGVVPLTFDCGGLSSLDGSETAEEAYSRTGYLAIQDMLVKPEKGHAFVAYFYDAEKQYIGCGHSFTEKAKKLLNLAPANAGYVRFLLMSSAEESEEELLEELSASGTMVPLAAAYFHAYPAGSELYDDFAYEADEEETKPTDPTNPTAPTDPSEPTGPTTPTKPEVPLILTADVPENQGVQNALWNMEQLVNITYTPIRTLPQSYKDYAANVTRKGIPYSSTRIDQSYVPNNVSFHTFMTALQNPNSYLYTVDLGEDYGNINGDTYYGTVCSTACGYALGIQGDYTTYQWTQIPGMSLLEEQDLQNLKLCDTIVGQGHLVMITGIVRDQYGRIVEVMVSEAGGIHATTKKSTITALEERFPADLYEYCRYTKLEDVTYTASEYVAVGDEVAQTVTYNQNIIPRKGDKANWRTSETVVLDVVRTGTYTHVELYKDGELVETRPITSVIKLTEAVYKTPGKYKARLIKEGTTSRSKWCQWLVTDAASVGELYEGTRKVKVSFSATNAEPLFVQWMNGHTNATVRITLLTDEQKEDGYGIFVPAKGDLKVRVAFKTDYGIIYSELPEMITVK